MLVAFQVILMIFMLFFGLFTVDTKADKDTKSLTGAITVISMLLLMITFLII